MDITKELIGDFMEVRAKGRLDGYWANDFASTLDDIVRQGHHRIRVNLSEVNYISSMGIGVLVGCYKSLQSIQGVLVISEPSPMVVKILDMVGLRTILTAEPPPRPSAIQSSEGREKIVIGDGRYDVYPLEGAGVTCRKIGNPALLEGCRFAENHCTGVTFPESSYGLGLGGFGESFDECKERFGEFMAVTAAAAYLPADGSNAPDYMLGRESFAPEVQVLYGLKFEGEFSRMARFEAESEPGSIRLSALAEAGLQIAGTNAALIVAVAESAGLAGVSLRKSPAGITYTNAPFGHPEVRNWLSFTTERTHARALTLICGVALDTNRNDFRDWTRPLGLGSNVTGHFHAAAFSYRPMQKGLIDLKSTVHSLFEGESLQGILHLIGDDRESTGVSESEFVRGALWVAPLLGDEK
jgi:anti-anti-sigma factor